MDAFANDIGGSFVRIQSKPRRRRRRGRESILGEAILLSMVSRIQSWSRGAEHAGFTDAALEIVLGRVTMSCHGHFTAGDFFFVFEVDTPSTCLLLKVDGYCR